MVKQDRRRGSTVRVTKTLAEPTGAAKSSTRFTRREAGTVQTAMACVEDQALAWIVNFLKQHRGSILMCKGMLESGQCNPIAIADSAIEKEAFHHTYVSFKSLPKYWIAEWLVNQCRFSPAFIDLIDAGGSSQVRQVFTYFTGIGESTYWPRPLLRKELLLTFLAGMLEKLGNRHEHFDKHVDKTGKINWGAGGPFTLKWAKDEVTGGHYIEEISHSLGDTVKMDLIRISDKFGIQEPWDDLRAQFSGDIAIRLVIADLFTKDAKFKVVLAKSSLSADAKRLEDEWTASQERQVKGEREILHTAKAKQIAKAKAASRLRVPACKVVTPLIVHIGGAASSSTS